MSTTTPNAYGHPRLSELVTTAQQTPFIGQVLIGTIRDLVHPQDRVLCCYYLMETSGATEDKDFTYYQIDVVLVTTAFFIRILFFPKTHTYTKKRIHSISELKIEYPAPPTDELGDLQAGEFMPSRVKLECQFVNDRGTVAENWTAEASDLDHVRHLMEINRQLGRLVGLPLAQSAGQAATGG